MIITEWLASSCKKNKTLPHIIGHRTVRFYGFQIEMMLHSLPEDVFRWLTNCSSSSCISVKPHLFKLKCNNVGRHLIQTWSNDATPSSSPELVSNSALVELSVFFLVDFRQEL